MAESNVWTEKVRREDPVGFLVELFRQKFETEGPAGREDQDFTLSDRQCEWLRDEIQRVIDRVFHAYRERVVKLERSVKTERRIADLSNRTAREYRAHIVELERALEAAKNAPTTCSECPGPLRRDDEPPGYEPPTDPPICWACDAAGAGDSEPT